MNWKLLFDGFIPQRKCEPDKSFGQALLSSLAPAGLSAVGSIASSLFGQSRQAEENQKNRDFALEMWNRNNEYNTPKAQRERLEEAGYNPYLLTQDASASGQSVMPSSPSSSPLPNFDMGLDGASRILQNGLQLEANVDEQRSKAISNMARVLIDSYKETGPEGFKQMWAKLEPSFSSLDFFNSPAYIQTMEQIDKIRIENDTNSLKKSLLDKFGAKEYEKKFEQIDQLISESASKIQLMTTEGHVNEGTVWKMGFEVGKLLAESNFLGAQATQISTLLPYMATKLSNEAIGSGYMKDIARYQSNMVGMDFFTKEAEFASNKKVRDLLHGDAAQNIQSWNKAMDSNFNPVFTFMKGVGSSLGSVVNPMKFTPLMEMPRNNSYFFNIGQ